MMRNFFAGVFVIAILSFSAVCFAEAAGTKICKWDAIIWLVSGAYSVIYIFFVACPNPVGDLREIKGEVREINRKLGRRD